MASLLKITTLHNNPGKMNEPYSFEIILDVREQLQEDIDIKVTYVGSSFDDEKIKYLKILHIDVVTRQMLDYTKITRTLSEPRITVFPCLWDAEEAPLQTKMEGDTNEQEILIINGYKRTNTRCIGSSRNYEAKEQQESFAEEKH
ncbi:Anti-silencing protein [Entamoeba marina]